jgi:Uma2 family endonuclease
MNAPVLPKKRMKVDEFLAWSARQPDDRYELVDGEVVAMTRDTVRHNLTKLAACRALDDAVRSAGLPCVVFIDGVGVAINDKTLRIPDVLVHWGAEPDPDALIVSPLIVVEVVSPSSERDDTDTKLIEYFSVASIRHYLIVFSEKRVVVHHRRNDGGDIATRIAHDGDVTLDPPGIAVPVLALLGPSSGRAGAG